MYPRLGQLVKYQSMHMQIVNMKNIKVATQKQIELVKNSSTCSNFIIMKIKLVQNLV
jgi:hypothetical protein